MKRNWTTAERCFQEWQDEELENIKKYVGEERFNNGKFKLAAEIFDDLVMNDHFEEFLTLSAYKYL